MLLGFLVLFVMNSRTTVHNLKVEPVKYPHSNLLVIQAEKVCLQACQEPVLQ